MGPSRHRLILVADDNEDMRKTLAVLLEIIGFKVAAAHNGRDAVSLARRCRPDVLLIDIGLPSDRSRCPGQSAQPVRRLHVCGGT